MIDDKYWKRIFYYFSSKKPKRLILMGDDSQLDPIDSIGLFPLLLSYKKKSVSRLSSNYRFSKHIISKINDIRKMKIASEAEYLYQYSDFNDLMSEIKEYRNEKILTPINYSIYGTKQLSKILTSEEFEIGDQIVFLDVKPIKGKVFRNKFAKIKEFIGDKIILDIKLSIKQANMINDCFEYGYYTYSDNTQYVFIDKNSTDMPIVKSNVITIHTAQGSTFDKVALIIPPYYKISWKMIYTAVSRCRKNFRIFVHQDHDLNSIGS